jgi:DNA adenine methylase
MLTGAHKSRDNKKENEEANSDRVIHASNILNHGDCSMCRCPRCAAEPIDFRHGIVEFHTRTSVDLTNSMSSTARSQKVNAPLSARGNERLQGDGRVHAKPFLKWAGGKTQLLPQIDLRLPAALQEGKVSTYVEPFLGGGAVFFHIAQTQKIRQAYLADANEDLIQCYQIVQRNVEELIVELRRLSRGYLRCGRSGQEGYFYRVREQYNRLRKVRWSRRTRRDRVIQAAYMIFLNRTCYNGLHRVNSRGDFNVPFGKYASPLHFNEENLRAASRVLASARLVCAPFDQVGDAVKPGSFVYFDPPYKPLSATASFTSYSRERFGDDEQEKLATLFHALSRRRNVHLMLSNSDPGGRYFDRLYKGMNIERVTATRMINSKASGRGRIAELIVTNSRLRKVRRK